LIDLTEDTRNAPIQIADIQLQIIEYNEVLEEFSILGKVDEKGRETIF